MVSCISSRYIKLETCLKPFWKNIVYKARSLSNTDCEHIILVRQKVWCNDGVKIFWYFSSLFRLLQRNSSNPLSKWAINSFVKSDIAVLNKAINSENLKLFTKKNRFETNEEYQAKSIPLLHSGAEKSMYTPTEMIWKKGNSLLNKKFIIIMWTTNISYWIYFNKVETRFS